MKVGIVIPTYNEKKAIYNLWKKISLELKNLDYFICFVDDTKDSSTYDEIIKYFNINYIKIIRGDKNNNSSSRCKASWLGFKWIINNTKSDIIVDLDADLAHDPKEILSAIKVMNETNCDIVISSKYKINSIVLGRSNFRKSLSFFYTLLCKIIFTNKISDYSNSFRFYKRNAIKSLLDSKTKIYNSPIQHLDNILFFHLNNFVISEIPCTYIERSSGKSTIKIKDLILYSYEFVLCIIKNKLRIS